MARTGCVAVRGIGYVAAENGNLTRLNVARPGDNAEQRRFPDTIRSDQPDRATRRYVKSNGVKRSHASVELRDANQARDWPGIFGHYGGSLCNEAGHATAGLVFT